MPPKKRAPKGMAKPLPPGQILIDLRKNQWKLGPLIGQGGFGYLYLGSDKTTADVDDNAAYVIKVEPHSNGPLFVELAFYQRAAKQEIISSWQKANKQAHLGVPRFIGSGLFENGGIKYRFMIMDRFGQDVEKLFLASSKRFPLQTVFSLGCRLVEALEYLHAQEYVHADIKASNILTGFGSKNTSLVYLVDYGLAYRYCPSGEHVPYKEDPKRKHDGTIEFTSRDAHKGLAPCRRGDLEILAYCMLQWICGKLPWENNLTNKDYVAQEKVKFMRDVSGSLRKCIGSEVPDKSCYSDHISMVIPQEGPLWKQVQLEEYFKYICKLEYDETPDYDRVKKWFKDAMKKSGFNDDGKSVLFMAVSPTKKKRDPKTDKLTNGETKKRKVVKIDDSSGDEVESPPRRQRESRSPSKTKSPAKSEKPARKQVKRTSSGESSTNGKGKTTKTKSPAKKTAETKTVARSSASKASPKKAAPRKESPNKASPKKTAPSSGTERTKRRVARKKNVATREFGQSP